MPGIMDVVAVVSVVVAEKSLCDLFSSSACWWFRDSITDYEICLTTRPDPSSLSAESI